MKAFIPFGGPTGQVAAASEARIVVLPLCYERDVSYGTGTQEAPLHILEASGQLERLDEETLTDWTALKIHTAPPLRPTGDPGQAVAQMTAAAAAYFDQKKFVLSLGGDHAAALGPIRAAARSHPDMGVLQIDAHLDLRDQWNGSRYNHACVMRRVVEDINLRVVQVGIRSIAPEELDYIKLRRLRPYFMHALEADGDCWGDAIIDDLPDQVYLTFDVDGLDPAVMPGTGTPEPGGFTYRQVLALIRELGRRRRVVGADITELVKIDNSQVSETTAAKLATKILVHCAGG